MRGSRQTSISNTPRPADRIEHMTIRLLIIDDHPIVRLGLAALLSLQGDIEVIGSVGSGQDALSKISSIPIDIVLVDLRMPGLSGVDTLLKIKEIDPRTRSIVLSSFEHDEEIYAAVKAGAKGYLHKEAPAEEILNAIRAVYSDREAFPRRIAERLSCRNMTAGLSEREASASTRCKRID